MIQGCGAHAADVKSLLNQAHGHIQEVTDAIDAGTPLNLKAYVQWFHGVNPDMLGPLLKNVVKGGVVPMNIGTTWPSIICLSAPFTGMTYYYDICKSDPKVVTIYMPSLGGVGLCPAFFDQPPVPTLAMCGKVVPGDLRAMTMLKGDNITMTQVGGLIHESIHMYLGTWALSPETFDVNRCASLPAKKSVRNPENYNYYISSMFVLSSSLSSR